jgi:hypothetical protein
MPVILHDDDYDRWLGAMGRQWTTGDFLVREPEPSFISKKSDDIRLALGGKKRQSRKAVVIAS